MAHKNLCKYSLLFSTVPHDAGRSDLLNTSLPLKHPAKQTWHQHTPLHKLRFCTMGKHKEQCSACQEQTPAQQCSRRILLWDRGGREDDDFKFSRKTWLPPYFFFFPPSFKCQAPTWFLWEFEQLVRSVWKQNKPQHISPFAELSKRRHALQSGDDSAFSSLGLGCRPKIQNIFLYICVESGLISD